MYRFLFILGVLLLSGCATYGDWATQMEGRIVAQDIPGALQVLEKRAGNRERDAVLFQLNRGMLLRLKEDLPASEEAFEQAKAQIEAVLAVSVSEQAGALAINDAQRSYTGEPYERAFLHFYAALNYLEQRRRDDARVEMLQLDVLLGSLNGGKPFAGAALPRYLSGMVFEAGGEWSDAMIAYRKAYEIYHSYPAGAVTVPRALGLDLVRLATRLALNDEAARYRKEFGLGEVQLRPRVPGEAELIVLLHSGLAPVMRESSVTVPTSAGRLVSISMPFYDQKRRPQIAAAAVTVDGAAARTELAEDIDAAARAALEARRGAIIARTAGRAVVKHEASRQVARENELVGLAVNIAGLITERADTRSWSTLPGNIDMLRLPIPAGEHTARIELLDRQGAVVETFSYPLTLGAGELHFVSLHRVLPADISTRSSAR
ncbi:MAG: hypothetical protein LBV36_05870 [Chromatiales bacterium]|jgi:hypothetical protein|nr:hypothetical protein [Chromatiales bacterium]